MELAPYSGKVFLICFCVWLCDICMMDVCDLYSGVSCVIVEYLLMCVVCKARLVRVHGACA